MVKKQNKVNWLTWLLAVIAIVALVLAIVAINKANMTGNSFWHFKQNAEMRAMKDVQIQTQTQSDMANYILVYDGNGEKVYEYEKGEINFIKPELQQNINNFENMISNQTNFTAVNNSNGTSDEPFGLIFFKLCVEGCTDKAISCAMMGVDPGTCNLLYENCVIDCRNTLIVFSSIGHILE